MLKMVAALAFLLSVFLVAVGAFGLHTFHGDDEWHSILRRNNIDPADWSLHWNASNTILMTFGLVGAIAAIGLWGKKRWARVVWLAVISCLALSYLFLFVTAIGPYPFELRTILDLVMFCGVAAVSWVVLLTSSISQQFHKPCCDI